MLKRADEAAGHPVFTQLNRKRKPLPAKFFA